MRFIAIICFALCTAGFTFESQSTFGDLISLTPTQDTFAMANDANATYGSAGALNVAGSSAVNGNGVAQGVFDTWLRFDTAAAVAQFDTTYGAGNWTLTSAVLSLREVAAPNNAIFNRGVGQFRVTWVDDDNWSEGPGGPGAPGTATGNQIGYTYGLSILNGGVDESLGVFTNAGNNTQQNFALSLSSGFAADVLAASIVTLYESAVSSQIGFTFNSSTTPSPPQLILQAVPEPMSALLLGAGFCLVRIRRARFTKKS